MAWGPTAKFHPLQHVLDLSKRSSPLQKVPIATYLLRHETFGCAVMSMSRT
jgi:hypothetical protein